LTVTQAHVQIAVQEAIDKAEGSIRSDYSKATASAKKEALYKKVLLACALAETDDLGWFYPREVRGPLELILKRTYKIEAFARHLHAFCDEARGPVLINDNRSVRPRFRFENPLMQPFVLLRGLAKGDISVEDLKILKSRTDPKQRDLF
jgi:hypothetical protein